MINKKVFCCKNTMSESLLVDLGDNARNSNNRRNISDDRWLKTTSPLFFKIKRELYKFFKNNSKLPKYDIDDIGISNNIGRTVAVKHWHQNALHDTANNRFSIFIISLLDGGQLTEFLELQNRQFTTLRRFSNNNPSSSNSHYNGNNTVSIKQCESLNKGDGVIFSIGDINGLIHRAPEQESPRLICLLSDPAYCTMKDKYSTTGKTGLRLDKKHFSGRTIRDKYFECIDSDSYSEICGNIEMNINKRYKSKFNKSLFLRGLQVDNFKSLTLSKVYNFKEVISTEVTSTILRVEYECSELNNFKYYKYPTSKTNNTTTYEFKYGAANVATITTTIDTIEIDEFLNFNTTNNEYKIDLKKKVESEFPTYTHWTRCVLDIVMSGIKQIDATLPISLSFDVVTSTIGRHTTNQLIYDIAEGYDGLFQNIGFDYPGDVSHADINKQGQKVLINKQGQKVLINKNKKLAKKIKKQFIMDLFAEPYTINTQQISNDQNELNTRLRQSVTNPNINNLNINIIKNLLRKGADPNIQYDDDNNNNDGDTLLHHMCSVLYNNSELQKKFQIIQLLLKFGANPNAIESGDDMKPRDMIKYDNIRDLYDKLVENHDTLPNIPQYK